MSVTEYTIVDKDELIRIVNAINNYSDDLKTKETKIVNDLTELKKTILIDNNQLNNNVSDISINFKVYRLSFTGCVRLFDNVRTKFEEAAAAAGGNFDSTYASLSNGITFGGIKNG